MLVLLAWLGSRRRKLSPKQIAAGGYPAACGSCGYDLTGLPGHICPECGSDLDLVGRLSPRFYRWSAAPITARLIVWTVCLGVIAAGLVYFAIENHLPRRVNFQANTTWTLQQRLPGLGTNEWDMFPVMSVTVTAWFTRRTWPSEGTPTSFSHHFPAASTRWTGAVVQSQAFSADRRSDQDGNPYWGTKYGQSGLAYLTHSEQIDPELAAAAAGEFGASTNSLQQHRDAEAAVILALKQAGYGGSHGAAHEIAATVAPEIETFLRYGAVSPQGYIEPWHASPTYGNGVGPARAEPLAVLVAGGFWFVIWLLGLPFILRKRPMSISRENGGAAQ